MTLSHPRYDRGCDFGAFYQGEERATGIEPAWPAWKAGTLPLSYARAESKLPRHPANANSFFREPAMIPYAPEHLVFECGRDKGGVVAAETK
jgi:hypothetical protein